MSVLIYTTQYCPFCVRAKYLLQDKKVKFTEVSVDNNQKKRSEMTKKAGGRTSVPQIWIHDQHIGGCDELFALERSGKLETLLAQY